MPVPGVKQNSAYLRLKAKIYLVSKKRFFSVEKVLKAHVCNNKHGSRKKSRFSLEEL
jgi:hypothetical protein